MLWSKATNTTAYRSWVLDPRFNAASRLLSAAGASWHAGDVQFRQSAEDDSRTLEAGVYSVAYSCMGVE